MKFSSWTKLLLIVLSITGLTSCTTSLDVQKLNQKATNLIKAGDVDGAIARLESINDIDPNYAETHYNLGIAYYQKKDYEKSIKSLSEAVKLNPNISDAYYTMGVIYEDMALTEIEKNKDKNPADIYNMFALSQQSFSEYLNKAKNPGDGDDVKEKIASLNSDISKYKTLAEKQQ